MTALKYKLIFLHQKTCLSVKQTNVCWKYILNKILRSKPLSLHLSTKGRNPFVKYIYTIDVKQFSMTNMAPTACLSLATFLNPPRCCHDPSHFQFLSLDCNSNFPQQQPPSPELSQQTIHVLSGLNETGVLRSGLIVVFYPCLIIKTPKHCRCWGLIPPCSLIMLC